MANINEDISSSGSCGHLNQADLDSATQLALSTKKIEIDRAAEAALKALAVYKELVTKEFAKSSLKIPTSFAEAEDAIANIDIKKNWDWHSAAMQKEKGEHRDDLRKLVIETGMKKRKTEEEVAKICREEQARLDMQQRTHYCFLTPLVFDQAILREVLAAGRRKKRRQ